MPWRQPPIRTIECWVMRRSAVRAPSMKSVCSRTSNHLSHYQCRTRKMITGLIAVSLKSQKPGASAFRISGKGNDSSAASAAWEALPSQTLSGLSAWQWQDPPWTPGVRWLVAASWRTAALQPQCCASEATSDQSLQTTIIHKILNAAIPVQKHVCPPDCQHCLWCLLNDISSSTSSKAF